MIMKARAEDLSFVFQSPEGPGVNDAVAITLKIVPVRVRQFRIPASQTLLYRKSEMSEWAQGQRVVTGLQEFR